jgi:D-lyxose ketol-isomerase
MKRSRINALIAEAEEFFARNGFRMPPFAHWTPQEWKKVKKDDHVIKANLGWDLTDYGRGDYDKLGLMLFTVRNGLLKDFEKGRGVVYAEKIMISKVNQLSPMHRHVHKTEDIINRAGGTLAIELYMMTPDGALDRKAPVKFISDGIWKEVPAGTVARFAPGESITLFPGVYHAFWAEGADVMIGEVSSVNDDNTDNFFTEPVARFPSIDEDVAPTRLIVGDYARL